MSRATHFPLRIIVLILAIAHLSSCAGSSEESTQYHCPMHPTYVSDGPGSCPICGMDLVPIPEASSPAEHEATEHEDGSGETRDPDGSAPHAQHGSVPGYSSVHATAEAIELAGVRTVPAVRGRLSRTVRAVGTVVADETRTYEVNARVSGWVEGISVGFTGQFVSKGDPLLDIYSPELVASQDEYLRARQAAERFAKSSLPEVRDGADDLVASARERLLSFGVPQTLVDRLDGTGESQRKITLLAPATGFVTTKNVLAGSRIEPAMVLFTISDLSRIWIDAAVYEQEAPLVQVGEAAGVTLPYDPSFKSAGRVTYIYPTLDIETRTIRVRVELSNPDFVLKPGMYADVELGLESAEGVLIPEDAVLDSGLRRVVFVKNLAGVFEPREVDLGVRSDGQALVLAGVAEGEQVVVRARFLLDSESRLRSAIGATSDAPSGSMPGMEMGAGDKQ